MCTTLDGYTQRFLGSGCLLFNLDLFLGQGQPFRKVALHAFLVLPKTLLEYAMLSFGTQNVAP